ncbi:MAG: hypothetical protein ACREMZ_01665 [Gemmatimonadales bacterium]
MPTISRLSVLAILLLATGCGSGRTVGAAKAEPELGDQPRARIENRASLDMDIYVIRGDGQALRLGFARGGESAVFALPPTMTAGASSVRFEARPVRGSGRSVVSEPFGVRQGDEITWSIPPQ